MTFVKICGFMRAEDALAAVRAGVDAVGLVLAESPRRVTPAQARAISLAVHDANRRVKVTGVFVNTVIEEVNRLADECVFDWIQLSGEDDWRDCRWLSRRALKAIHVRPGMDIRELRKEVQAGASLVSGARVRIILDAYAGARRGGTGQKFDWSLAETLAQESPVMVAGGLAPENVAEVMERVRPWGVDVSSGVETGGRKDPAKIVHFIETVRRTDARLKGVGNVR
jgi:phosphoribosylanthranilate isomerase